MSFLQLSPKTPFGFIHPLATLRTWINAFEVRQVWLAQWICRLVPNTCSAGYTLRLFGRTLQFPSLCELNPLNEELVDLRFRAADFLYEQSEHSI